MESTGHYVKFNAERQHEEEDKLFVSDQSHFDVHLVADGSVASSNSVTTQYFSKTEEESKAERKQSKRTLFHKAKRPEDEAALELGALCIQGQKVDPLKTLLSIAVLAGVLACIVLAAYYYPRSNGFTLTRAQQWIGFVGVIIVLGGAALLMCLWLPGWTMTCMCAQQSLASCGFVRVSCEDGKHVPVAIQSRVGLDGQLVRFFEFRHLRFIFDADKEVFAAEVIKDPMQDVDNDAAQHGLTSTDVAARRAWHGKNLIDVPMPSVPRQLVDEILTPFVWFQLFSVVQWYLELYWIYAVVIAGLTIVSVVASLLISRAAFQRLRELSRRIATVQIVRDGVTRTVESTDIVPGDLVVIEQNMEMTFDAVLLSGECLVNESMLTGESVPALKFAIKRGGALLPTSTLYCGTAVVQTTAHDGRVLARVWKTGFSSMKGSLIRSILFPRKARLDLYQSGVQFVLAVLVPMAVAGGIASIVSSVKQGAFTIAKALDLVTIAIPPALPTTMQVGIVYAVARLRYKQVYCISPNRVNMAGKVDTVCFDKTGTLTEDGLGLHGVRCVARNADGSTCFDKEVDGDAYSLAALVVKVATSVSEQLAWVMGGCHTLRALDSRGLVGDPLEIRMFEAAQFKLLNGGQSVQSHTGHAAKVVRICEFDAVLKRMSVVVAAHDDTPLLLMKGSPETVVQLCSPNTVPSDFHDVLDGYARSGYRVIACATRSLSSLTAAEAAAMPRDGLEVAGQLQFVGLVIMENKLKPESAGVIEQLQHARIRCCMITGDHALTAIAVSRNCGILPPTSAVVMCDGDDARGIVWKLLHQHRGSQVIDFAMALQHDHFVITGAGFEALMRSSMDVLVQLLPSIDVAARFQPHQKQRLVELLVENGKVTSFVGDGANDTAALKAADVGLSLTCDAEASVAAPFTSKNASISGLISLLLEGRASITTSFHLFKYMALYAFLQFVNSLQMNLINTYLGQYEFLFIDVLVVLPLALALPNTKAYHKLSPLRPVSSLMHWTVLGSVVLQAGSALAFQIGIRKLVQTQCWYQPLNFQCCADDSSSSRRLLLQAFDAGNATSAASCPYQAYGGQCLQSCDTVFADIVPSFDNTVMWLMTNLQYVFLFTAWATAKPFRQPIYTNITFTALWIANVAMWTALIFVTNSSVLDFISLIPLPDDNFRWAIFGFAACSGVAMYVIEYGIHEAHEQMTERDVAAAGSGWCGLLQRVVVYTDGSKPSNAETSRLLELSPASR